MKINWGKVLLFAVVTGGLVLITGSFLMTLGILLILFVLDYAVTSWAEKHSKNR